MGRIIIACNDDYQPLVERWAPLVETKPVGAKHASPDTDLIEVAMLAHNGQRHILAKRDGMPHEKGTAKALCGIHGWFEDTRYLSPNGIALDKKRTRICHNCYAMLAKQSRTKYEVEEYCDRNR